MSEYISSKSLDISEKALNLVEKSAADIKKNENDIQKIKSELVKQGAEKKAPNLIEPKAKVIPVGKISIDEKEFKNALAKIKNHEVKAMTVGANLVTGSTYSSLRNEVVIPEQPNTVLIANLSFRSFNEPKYKFISIDETKNGEAVADGGAASIPSAETSMVMNVVEYDTRKVKAYATAEETLLDDVAQASEQIENVLTRALTDELEEQLYLGDNTGNNCNGLVTQAQTFDGTDPAYAAKFGSANMMDLILSVATEIAIGS